METTDGISTIILFPLDASNSMEEPQPTQNNLKNPPKPHTPITSELCWFFALATCLKLLLIPAYRSTDFEVHRHWLAITHSLPLSQWYFDETSPWTLDYPPFFAYFERLLSLFANLIDPQIVHLQNGLNYTADTVVYFQRVSVCVSDLVLLFGVYRLSRRLDPMRRKVMWVLVVWSPMLVIVDHLHFQYNGMLIGLLLVSVSCLEEGSDLMGGFVFAVLCVARNGALLMVERNGAVTIQLLKPSLERGRLRGLRRFKGAFATEAMAKQNSKLSCFLNFVTVFWGGHVLDDHNTATSHNPTR